MQKLNFNTGIEKFEMPGGAALRFNPSDPNVYDRLCDSLDAITVMENEFDAKCLALDAAENEGNMQAREKIKFIREMDERLKAQLTFVFGADNDFDKMLGGVSLLAVGEHGERLITNLLAVLTPIIEKGAKAQVKTKANTAVGIATANRAERRAKQKAHK